MRANTANEHIPGHQATGPRGKGTALVQAGNAGVNWQGCDLLVSYFLSLKR